MYIRYENILIRNATPDDAALLAGWWNDGKVMAHAGFPNGVGTTEEAVRRGLEKQHEPQSCTQIILFENKPIGEMNYVCVGDRTYEIGIKICDASYQNRGLGKKILSVWIEKLFDELGTEKVVLDTNLKNTRAQHVYEELGFRKTSVAYDAGKNQLGELQSFVNYEITRGQLVCFHEKSRHD